MTEKIKCEWCKSFKDDVKRIQIPTLKTERDEGLRDVCKDCRKLVEVDYEVVN
jgi:hypothetical protein